MCTAPSVPAVWVGNVPENCIEPGSSQIEYYAICSETHPGDCFVGIEFSNLRWYQGKLPYEIAEAGGFGSCFEYIAPYTVLNPVPECCPEEVPPP